MDLIHKQFQIPVQYHGQRVDAVVAQLLPEYSRSQITTWIKSGALLINNQPCKPKDKANAGSNIELKVSFVAEDKDFQQCQPEDLPLDVVYEDDDLLVINKPTGLVVHPGAGNREHTLVNALLYHAPELKQLPRAGIIHRLDKETTGLLIVAKTLIAHTALIRLMQAREIQRHYLALVNGHIVGGDTIETAFGRHPKNRLKMAVVLEGKTAITQYRVQKQYTHFTLLDVSLFTGRTHQIRVHLSHIHHPVVGDPLYGRKFIPANASPQLRTLLQNFKRQALHAATLTFTHPISGKQLTCTATIPDDFQELINALDNDYEN